MTATVPNLKKQGMVKCFADEFSKYCFTKHRNYALFLNSCVTEVAGFEMYPLKIYSLSNTYATIVVNRWQE